MTFPFPGTKTGCCSGMGKQEGERCGASGMLSMLNSAESAKGISESLTVDSRDHFQ